MSIKPPQVTDISRYGEAAEQVIVKYNAEYNWYHPSNRRPWSSDAETFTCTHGHATKAAARKCGERGATKAAKAWQAMAEATFPHHACEIKIHREERIYRADGEPGFGEEPGFLVYCDSHGTNGSVLHRSEEIARAADWTCPWAPFVKAGA